MTVDTDQPAAATLMTAAARRRPATVVLIGAAIGLTWSAALRGWMVQLAGASSTFTWLTLGFVLVPGAVVGALLGRAVDAHARGRTPRRILVCAPVLLAAVLLDPRMLLLFLRRGYGGGSLMIVVTALTAGYALTHRRLSLPTALCGLVAASGLAAVTFMGTMAAPLTTARGAWVCVFGLALMLVLCLAGRAAPPARSGPRPLGSRRHRGAVRSGLGGRAAELHGRSGRTRFPGHLGEHDDLDPVGGRDRGRPARRRRVAVLGGASVARADLRAPVVRRCPAARAAAPDDDVRRRDRRWGHRRTLLGMAGAYALAGHRTWARVLCGSLFLAGMTLWVVVADDVGGSGFALDTARGLWATLLYLCLLATLALAATLPLRASANPLVPAPGGIVGHHG